MSKDHFNGIKKENRHVLENLVGQAMAEGLLLDAATLELLANFTLRYGREILLVISDRGVILDLVVGQRSDVDISQEGIDENRRTLNRVRIIHTHPGGSPRLSSQDISAAESLLPEAMIAIGVDDEGKTTFGVGYPVEVGGEITYEERILTSLDQLNAFPLKEKVTAVNRGLKRQAQLIATGAGAKERGVLVGINGGATGEALDHSLAELARLLETAGGKPVAVVTQNRGQVDPMFYVGRGKILEIRKLIQDEKIDVLVTNDELSAGQIAAIEAVSGVKVIDRTTLILDIFARHATTMEGKLQVELAQQKYRLSHLRGLGHVLSRTGGGIGTRGPGEKKLETDRRHIRRQLDELTRRLKKIEKQSDITGARREKSRIRTAALVGYTNSGKSTLFNRLTDSDVVVKDGLFITLDSTIRKVKEEHGNYLLSDTVGFIEKLPHELIQAFKTTLREVERADLLLHVVDVTNPNYKDQMTLVEQVLREIGVLEKEILVIYNKVDLLTPEARRYLTNQLNLQSDACLISAKTGEGVESLTEKIAQHLDHRRSEMRFLVAYGKEQLIALLHQWGEVVATDYRDDGTEVTVVMDKSMAADLERRYGLEPLADENDV